jgi:hypothetical protein
MQALASFWVWHHGVSVDHTCPVVRALDLRLLAGSPVTSSWCPSSWRDVIAALDPVAAPDPRLLLWGDGTLSVHYAPWDWVNTTAKVMLAGITPGARQAAEALREAQARLRAGSSSEETLRRADAVGSFSGPMRAHLVTMLDGVGLADALGVDRTARLFDTHHHLAALCSAIDYPVFVNGQNYGGASPPLTWHPVLRSLVRVSLGASQRAAGGVLADGSLSSEMTGRLAAAMAAAGEEPRWGNGGMRRLPLPGAASGGPVRGGRRGAHGLVERPGRGDAAGGCPVLVGGVRRAGRPDCQLSRLTAATSWQWIPTPLLASGVYQGILQSAGIAFTAPCPAEIHGVNLARGAG